MAANVSQAQTALSESGQFSKCTCQSCNAELTYQNPCLKKWFCRTCNQYCRVQDHPNHDLCYSETESDFLHNKIYAENTELKKNVKPFYKRALEYISKEQSDIPQCFKTAKEHIDICEHLLHKQVAFAARYFKNVLEEKERKQMTHISNLRKIFEKCLDELEETLQENCKLLNVQDLTKLCKFQSSVDRWRTNTDLTGFEKPIFKPNLMVHETSPHFLGNIIYEEPQNCSNQLNIPTINLENIQNRFLRQADVVDVLQRRPPEHGLCDVTCVESQRILTSGQDKRLHLLDLSIQDGDRILQTYKVSCESPHIAMSESRAVFYSDKRDKTIKQIESLDSNRINTVLHFDNLEPRGLAFSPANHLLICLVGARRSIIARYDARLKLVREIEFKDIDGTCTKLFKEPTFVCSNEFSDVCVADHALREVIVVNFSGVFQFSYRGQDEKSFRPHCLVTDNLSNIVVSDSVNQEVHVLDKYGQFVTLLTTGQKIGHPGPMSIDDEGKLWIGESVSGKIKVLKYLD